ncbi:MAG: amidohydrolase [Planctomycetes bacterium]|nr:amidohydrolase [Planctomycetota bacterium]
MKILDVHCHYQMKDGYLDQMLEAAAAAGVEMLCLNGGGPRWRQQDNDGVMAAAEKHPAEVIPFAFVFLGEHSATDVRAWHKAGFKGLKTQYPTRMYDDEAFFPIYAAAEELRMPILFHTGISARFPEHDRWDTSSRYMMPLTLDRIARCFPGLTLWGAHLGVPDTWHAAMLMAVHPNVHFDLCGIDTTGKRWTTICNFGQMFYRGEAHWGKLVFGSEGGPAGFAPLAKNYKALMDEAGVSEAVQHKVFCQNAADALGMRL